MIGMVVMTRRVVENVERNMARFHLSKATIRRWRDSEPPAAVQMASVFIPAAFLPAPPANFATVRDHDVISVAVSARRAHPTPAMCGSASIPRRPHAAFCPSTGQGRGHHTPLWQCSDACQQRMITAFGFWRSWSIRSSTFKVFPTRFVPNEDQL
jgi:hypothetical protein